MTKLLKTKHVLILFVFVISSACTTNSNNIADNDGYSSIPLVMDSTHSALWGNGESYKIKQTDSVIFDIANYKFRFEGEHYNFIRENIEESYLPTFPGSFSSADILYNDSLRFWIKPEKVIDDSIFAFPTVMDSLKKVGVTKFDLVFTYYLDNGMGEDIIDRFPIEIVE